MIGLFGGAFDPPHNGHVALLHAARRELGLGRVLVLVASKPGHKLVETPAEVRLELARAAFPGEEVELDEHPRTVDLLRAHPEWDEPVVLIGADQLAAFACWKEPEEVLQRARLGVAARPGYTPAELEAALEGLSAPERVLFFELEPLAIASSELRTRLGRGEDTGRFVSAAVGEIIERDGLYRPGGGYTPVR